MATVSNNRISQTIDANQLSQVKAAFLTITQNLPFLVGLSSDEKISMAKISVSNKQFVQDALMVMNNNSMLFPTYMSADELNKDITLYTQLDELVTISQQLTEKLRDTQILAGSEAYIASLSVYRLIEAAAKAGMPGADTAYDQLAERFANQGGTGSTTTVTPTNS
jgi:hypothetical protein